MAGTIKVRLIRPIRNIVLYSLLQVAVVTLKLFPRRFVLYVHGRLALVFYYVLSNTRRCILHHLSLAFGGEKSPEEIVQMGRGVLVNLGKTFTDYIFFSKLTTRQEFSEYFSVEGEEYLKKAYDKGKGVLCLIPHTCGWEFSAIMPPVLGYETSAISRELKIAPLNKMMIGFREKRRMKNISRNGNVYGQLIGVLERGECLIMMIDQDSMKVKGEFLKFFNLPAYTPLGCARLAIETGAAIVPMATYRMPGDTYLFKILPEVPMVLTGNTEYDVRYNTQIHNNILEGLIREYPEQWVWMHRRWHTTPQKLAEYWEKRVSKKEKETFTSMPHTPQVSMESSYPSGVNRLP